MSTQHKGGYGPIASLRTLLVSTARAWHSPPKNVNIASRRRRQQGLWLVRSLKPEPKQGHNCVKDSCLQYSQGIQGGVWLQTQFYVPAAESAIGKQFIAFPLDVRAKGDEREIHSAKKQVDGNVGKYVLWILESNAQISR